MGIDQEIVKQMTPRWASVTQHQYEGTIYRASLLRRNLVRYRALSFTMQGVKWCIKTLGLRFLTGEVNFTAFLPTDRNLRARLPIDGRLTTRGSADRQRNSVR